MSRRRLFLGLLFLITLWVCFPLRWPQFQTVPEADESFQTEATIRAPPSRASEMREPSAQPPPRSGTLSPAQEIYCDVLKANANIPLGGEIKIMANDYRAKDGKNGAFVMVYSSHCPPGLYSIVKLDNQKQVEEQVSCQSASVEQLIKSYQLQWNIEDAPNDPGSYNLAISGLGSFIVECQDGSLYMTRRGHFEVKGNYLVNDMGCKLVEKSDSNAASPLMVSDMDDSFDERGCLKKEGKCFATADVNDSIVKDFKFVNPDYFKVVLEGKTKDVPASYVFSNALEDLDDPGRGPTGIPNWTYIPKVEVPTHCL